MWRVSKLGNAAFGVSRTRAEETPRGRVGQAEYRGPAAVLLPGVTGPVVLAGEEGPRGWGSGARPRPRPRPEGGALAAALVGGGGGLVP